MCLLAYPGKSEVEGSARQSLFRPMTVQKVRALLWSSTDTPLKVKVLRFNVLQDMPYREDFQTSFAYHMHSLAPRPLHYQNHLHLLHFSTLQHHFICIIYPYTLSLLFNLSHRSRRLLDFADTHHLRPSVRGIITTLSYLATTCTLNTPFLCPGRETPPSVQ